MVFALKQGKQAASREFWIDTTPLSVEPPLVAVDGTTSYLGNMGCSRLSSTVTGIVYRGPFCSMFRTIRDPRLPRRVSTRHQYPSSPPRTRRPFYTSRRHGTRDIHRDNRGPKAKGNGTARFRIKLFSLSYPQRQPFCPGKRYSSRCSCYGEGWFPATLGRVSLSLSLSTTEKEAMEETGKIEVFVRGGVNRPFRCRCPLPFRLELPLIFSYFEIITYGFSFSKLFKQSVDEKFQRWQETRSNGDILFCN